jgi:hypothetical protein
VAVVSNNFPQLHQFEFGEAPLEEIHQIGESGPQIHFFGESRFDGAGVFG